MRVRSDFELFSNQKRHAANRGIGFANFLPVRVLVCGGRDYADRERVFAVLDKLHTEAIVELIIHGDARGADTLAGEWAARCMVQCHAYPADWEAHGSFAGPKRNKAMLDEGQPDLVVAFPGGAGTRNMIRQARKAGVEVVEIA